ncbi:4Fe-4S dicluster domain-containing protein [Calderihabitans maritimus]|uniref:Heterodisulfide reductase n=1 Tax=Calderihabitans maritimus TaxID=1246530 RepID=A0A1Z5HNK6_9FIRM|nr:4Fe-4S dicluster domain-containing protein [Calderihabitans maritimus]GAW91109.1 heterodisulfide reductase [Calderihabitans maritimus]
MPALAKLPKERTDTNFLEQILALPGGETILKCMQCGTCSGSCPTSYQMDYTPRRIIAMIRAGMKEQVLRSAAIWLCASCYSCSVRCPRGIEFTEIMYLLKSLAIKENILPEKHDSSTFYRVFSDIVIDTGRLNENKLIARYSFETDASRLWKQFAPLGFKLLLRRRISFIPAKIKNKEEFRRLIQNARIRGDIQ